MAPETPKGASSTLLSMKFMQRAAAADSTPGTDSDGPSSKKRKLGSKDGEYDLNINSASIQAAIDERDAKRLAALAQHSSKDTHWVLDGNVGKKAGKAEKKPMKVLYVGYDDLDSGDEDEDKARPGRTSTKDYKKTAAPKPKAASKDEDGDGDDTENSPADGKKRKRNSTTSDLPHRSLSRSNSTNTPEAEKAKQFRDQRKKKDVKINQITSISNQGGGGGSSGASAMTCFICQKKGHKASDCPQKGSKKPRGKH